MLSTNRETMSVGEMLTEESLVPLNLTQGALAEVMGGERKLDNEICNDRRAVTADTALMLARAFGNSPDFWLDVQRCTDLWDALDTPKQRQRIELAKALQAVG
jgi:addiction module HigA family antidote